MTRFRLAFNILLIALLSRDRAFADRKVAPYRNMREAIQALRSAKSSDEESQAYDALAEVPIRDADDLTALYTEAKRRDAEVPLVASDKAFSEYLRKGQIINAAISHSTDTSLQQGIADLINEEAQNWPSESRAHRNLFASRGNAKKLLYIERVKALINSAGEGKNHKARPALWRMLEQAQNDYFGQLSIDALGKIGEAEDLDRFIGMIEKNPQLNLQFRGFGKMAIPRVLRDIEDPNIPDSVKPKLTVGLYHLGSHETLPAYLELLDHSNASVAQMASTVVSENLDRSDESQIAGMLKSSSERLRNIALLAVDGRAWNPKLVPLLLDILKKDESKENRARAASCLGYHQVESAIPALQAALSDPSKIVRQNARNGLKALTKDKK